MKRLAKSWLPFISVLFLVGFTSLLIPIVESSWIKTLGLSFEVNTGDWAPTIQPVSCTYSFGYWKTHPKEWPAKEITIGVVTYSKAQAIQILKTPPAGDATYILAQQLIAAPN